MSGHSHFSSIKHKKGIADAKRGKIFSKLARMISVAARQGENPDQNSKLKQALDKARGFNMPKENIERAIKKASREIEKEKLEEITYEAFGPKGAAIIIEGITDNKNRTLAEIKKILQKYEAKLAESGSVKWLFEKKGVITLNIYNNQEELELKAIEFGAEDIERPQNENILEIYTKPEKLEKIKKFFEIENVPIESTLLIWIAKKQINLPEKDLEFYKRFFEELTENDAVQDIYFNIRT